MNKTRKIQINLIHLSKVKMNQFNKDKNNLNT